MKRISAMTVLVLIMVLAVLFASCGSITDWIASGTGNVTESGTETETAEQTAAMTSADTVTETESDAIPFSKQPAVSKHKLPEETFSDPLEEEAAGIIDGAISKALGCLDVMRDGRHSDTVFPFDDDANGYIGKLSESEKALCSSIIAAASEFSGVEINEKNYEGDLKSAYFAVQEQLTYGEPVIASYFIIDAKSYLRFGEEETYMKLIFDRYFDPYRDANYSVESGDADMDKIIHDAKLLDRVIKRVVRFMPEGLSAYDRYYYLAAVLAEQVVYDAKPANCWTAFGALVCGRAVCEGYSTAYYALCREANLWCAYRNGIIDGAGHMWNMIKLDSGIYNVDVTWCDGAPAPYFREWYKYFVKSDEYFAGEGGHSFDEGVKGTGRFEPCPYENYSE